MKTYNVAEVAILLNVNEETVRRWIRNGKLNATRKRGREGNRITLEDIKTMLKAPEFRKLNTDYMRMIFASENPIIIESVNYENCDESIQEITEDKNDTIEISKEILKSKLNELIAMRDCLNKQIDDIICLL